MKCPRCSSEMNEVLKSEVVVDVCPGCGGIFLDKGEMAKIVSQMKEAEAALSNELGVAAHSERRAVENRAQYGGDDRHRDEQYVHHYDKERRYDKHRDDHGHDYHGAPRRKKSAFQNLFDIFD